MKSHKTFRAGILPVLFVPALIIGLHSARANAATLVVTSVADPGVGGCTASGNGDGCTLREAITDANNQTLTPGDDTINATSLNGVISLNTALPPLATNIILNGPGPARLIVQRSQASNTPEFRIFHIDNTTTSGPVITLSGFSVVGGRVSGGSAPANSGGAIYNNHGTLTINNISLRNNFAVNGGAICNDGSSTANAILTINNTSIVNNTATAGGGIFNNGSSGGSTPLIINSSVFTGNNATSGGAILNDGHNGGSATLVINTSSLYGNAATNGGAINNDGVTGSATQAINYSTLSGNTASANGGAINNDGRIGGSATLKVGNSTFSGNSATAKGGALNNGGTGGSATAEFDNSTVHANGTASTSAAIDSDGTGGSATLALGSTILSNSINLKLTINSETTFTSKKHNLSSDAASGDGTTMPGGFLSASGDMRNTDARLGSLQNNGGTTFTVALQAGSPAINAGHSTSTSLTDQRGYSRAGIADIGAFEFNGVPPDSTPPTIAIANPGNNAFVQTLPAITGTAADNLSGVVRVDLYLQRKSDNKFWNGAAWGVPVTALSTVLTGAAPRQWTRNSGLPSGANLASGAYFVAARAFDAAGNGTSATLNFYVDTVAPAIIIATPANNASVSSLPAISGTASDNTGVVRVDLYLQRKSDNKFWNGAAWSAPVTALSTVLTGAAPRQWTRNSGLPTGANLASGAYFTAARAFDAADNGTSATANFSVASNIGAATATASNIQLSSATAKSDGTIRLTFTGALGQSAGDAANYVVNNGEVEIAGVSQLDVSTVEIKAGALISGARISVSYTLEDGQGRSIVGTATVIVK